MKAPTCKLCGEMHWSPVCPNVGGKKKIVERMREIEKTPPKTKAKKKPAKRKAQPVPDRQIETPG